MYAPRKPQVNRFCTVKPICQVRPHQAIMHENKQTMALETMMIAIAWPTERPWVSRVLGVCHVATFRAPLRKPSSVQCLVKTYDIETYRLPAPKKLNHPHVRLDGGKGTKSRLHHAVVSSLCVSSALSTAASLILLKPMLQSQLATSSRALVCSNINYRKLVSVCHVHLGLSIW
jgi:hypothetical protein